MAAFKFYEVENNFSSEDIQISIPRYFQHVIWGLISHPEATMIMHTGINQIQQHTINTNYEDYIVVFHINSPLDLNRYDIKVINLR